MACRLVVNIKAVLVTSLVTVSKCWTEASEERRAYFGSEFEGAVHPIRECTVAGLRGSWS